MIFTSSRLTIIFCVVLLFVLPQSTHEYTYSCDSTASCGCSSNSASIARIVGGESAGASTWGWAVSISVNGGLCGGAILSSSWVITAGGCVNRASPSQVVVYAGSSTQYTGQASRAYRIVVNPGYIDSPRVNDIALIQLYTPFTITGAIDSICLPSVTASTLSAGEWPPAGLYVVAVGWGTLSQNGVLPSVLQQVTLQTVDYRASSCSSILNDRVGQFCAGVSGGGKDTCQGDLGGPLMMFTTSSQWELVGVTSYGIGCAGPYYSHVFTRVAAYQSWIATTTDSAYISPYSSDSANINPFSSTASSNVSSTAPSRAMQTPPVSRVKFFLLSLVFPLFLS